MTASSPSGIQDALLNARDTYDVISKDATNPFTNSSYATLDNVLKCVKKALTANQINWLQKPSIYEGKPVLITKLTHTPSKEVEEGIYPLPDTNNPQQFGAAITYARRYSLPPMLGIATEEDDDGEAAKPKAKPVAPNSKPPGKPAPKKAPAPSADDGDEPEQGKDGYDTLLERFKQMCDTYTEDDILQAFYDECGVEFNSHYSESRSPRPFMLKSYLMRHGVKFDKQTGEATGLTKSKYDAVNALFDAIEIGANQ